MNARQIEIRELAPIEVVAAEHRGPYGDMQAAFARLAAWIDAQGLFGPDACCLGIFHDDPAVVPAAQLRSHACFALGPDTAAIALPEPFEHLTIAGGTCAVLIHEGPYDTLGGAYAWLFGEWLPSSGHVPADAPSFEAYLNDPRTTPPERLLTAIHLPLR
ncbi:AraC family transcriptional regulator [Burkholderia sp. Ac-20379]|uniref:AraC family transcriptional regulator n=1 Tax=Burkholderia sp. Ac-20379 TaxID=2703900 RepID=UPI0019803408|nr:GyrI-like domain-containing protein [Burkholderia sp. Ac-20379]MBN3728423.1 GyrI-like domain-containing protein [Burkholderia sp. Ac-20379]